MTKRFARPLAAAAAFLAALPVAAHSQNQPPRRVLTEILRIDANTEDFSALRLVRQGNAPFYVSPRGDLVVPLPQDATIRVYDPEGRIVTSVGQRGSGPGEFRDFFRLGWVRDTMWVYDAVQRRMSYFGPDWSLLRTTVLPASLRQRVEGPDPRVMSDFAPSAITRHGTIVGQAIMVEGRAPAGWLQFRYFVAAVGRDSGVRLLTPIPANAVSPRAYVTTPASPGYVFGIVPFANDALYAVSPDGTRFAIVTTNHAARTFTFDVHSETGEKLFSVTRPFEGRRISGPAIDSAVAAATRHVRQGPEVISALQARMRELVPGAYPPVTSVVFSRDGSYYLRLQQAQGDEVLVLDGRGTPTATFAVARNVDIVDTDGDRIWAAETDSDGLTSIVVYRARRN
jgi:hypothetical protein